jgi:hypothetical protein
LELVCTKKVFYPILLFPTFSPQPDSLFDRYGQTDRQTEKFQHPFHPYFFFFPLSARGPTRRRNSIGLAELWGGWPIEQVGWGGKEVSQLKRILMEWEFINSVTIQLDKIVFQNFCCNKIKMKYDILNK